MWKSLKLLENKFILISTFIFQIKFLILQSDFKQQKVGLIA
jgi:hypothetical protein